ncbi:hypothetical protein [Carboxylicivirga sp. M1479]|uniref:hypothetical protein n=1 Tax=Carboxylicivirga sp. M1479 TaxID=2594476 RepID=UPI001177B4B3|nr:hypothetical protein [Carboxylicivirga sp. M1479]TRX71519.1 hypothetical protein FNN09_05990 [Carboxylicivirga sp. M1479]
MNKKICKIHNSNECIYECIIGINNTEIKDLNSKIIWANNRYDNVTVTFTPMERVKKETLTKMLMKKIELLKVKPTGSIAMG